MNGLKIFWARLNLDLFGQEMIVGTKGTVIKDTESKKIIEIGASWPEKY